VHHDIKPENIMFDPESEIVKIVDFGEAIELKGQS
jgi:serine/threonine protein kinase